MTRTGTGADVANPAEELPNRRYGLFIEVPAAAIGLLLAWGIWWDAGARAGLAALLVGVSSFGSGLVVLLWLYWFARRRVAKNIKPKKWEYVVESWGPYALPPAIALGMWSSSIGADTTWGDILGVAAALGLAGFIHGLVFVEPPVIPETY